MTDQLSPSKSSDGDSIASQPRLRDADWTWERIWRVSRYAVITIINLTIFAFIWEGVANWYGNYNFFPKFSDMMSAFWTGWFGGGDSTNETFDLLQDFVIARNFWVTLKLYLIAMATSIVVGIPLGLLMGGSKWIDAIFSPYVWTLSSLPRIAIAPILILFLGLGDAFKFAVIISTAIFPVIINTWAGVKTTEQSLINAARVFGASKSQIYQKVVLPYTLPFVVSGIQLSLSRGLVGVVIAEFLSGASKDGGVGWLIFRSARTFNAALTYAALLSLALFALFLVQGTRSMESRIAPWRQVSKT
ncbi:MAG: ABC transporter permease [Acidimicrobiia bacterium]|nr:ABC transporter permease [Acidimicrobiia bacterium]